MEKPMGRTVISRRDVLRARAVLGPEGHEAQVEPDNYGDRLIKYIPPDVIVAYMTIEGMIGDSKQSNALVLAWVAFPVILLATPAYLIRFGDVQKRLQLLVSTVAFVVWAMAYPALPFKDVTGGFLSSVLLCLYTFFIPLITVD
jgi:hypothetical protein